MLLTQPTDELTEQLSTPETGEFNYDLLNGETRFFVQQCTTEIKGLIRSTAQNTIVIGQKLIKVKQQLGHGNFRNWLKAEFEWGISTAAKFMQVSEKFECVKFTHLDIAVSALYLLAAPSTPRSACEEALKRASQGEAISYTKAKAIVSQYKEAVKPVNTLLLKQPTRVDVSAEMVDKNARIPARFRQERLIVEVQDGDDIVARSDDKLAEAVKDSIEPQTSKPLHNTSSIVNTVKERAKADIDSDSLLKVGNLIFISDLEHSETKLLGKVAEIKEVNSTSIEIIIKK